MKPSELFEALHALITERVPLHIWGACGVGKSQIVAEVASDLGWQFLDIRAVQLDPVDLRGLPRISADQAEWVPPKFLPTSGKGILFLDEVNLAPPAMQGMAQQLILDRKIGSYTLPEGWFVWAAGNRKEDRAAVYDMPSPLANRFVHLLVEPDFESFKAYALANEVHEQILAFLSFRPELLHKLDAQQPAWPSPRSWVMASTLHKVGLDIATVIGAGAAAALFARFASGTNPRLSHSTMMWYWPGTTPGSGAVNVSE